MSKKKSIFVCVFVLSHESFGIICLFSITLPNLSDSLQTGSFGVHGTPSNYFLYYCHISFCNLGFFMFHLQLKYLMIPVCPQPHAKNTKSQHFSIDLKILQMCLHTAFSVIVLTLSRQELTIYLSISFAFSVLRLCLYLAFSIVNIKYLLNVLSAYLHLSQSTNSSFKCNTKDIIIQAYRKNIFWFPSITVMFSQGLKMLAKRRNFVPYEP